MGKRTEASRRYKRKRTAAIVIIIVVIALVACGFVGYNYIKGKFGKIGRVELDKDKVQKSDLDEATQKTFEGNTTIALFGLDNRSTGYYDRGNSDVIMIVNVNNDTKKLQVVSVYRDTFLNIQNSDGSFHKANAAYAYGGPEQAISMLNKNLDLDIDNYVTFDFATVADAIDVLGGVEIEIESQSELGYLNDYIEHTNGILGTNAEYVYSTGTQNLSGVQAVAYGRIRYTSGSDFRRAERHRLVLTQLLKKAKKANIAQLNELMDVVFPQIKTDLTQKQITDMMSVMLDYDLKDSRGFPFEKCSKNMGGNIGWVDVPCDLETNVKELHEYLYGTENYDPTEAIKEYSYEIINQTGLSAESAEKDRYEEIDNFDGSNDNGAVSDGSDSTEE